MSAMANTLMGTSSGAALPRELDSVKGDDILANHVNKYYVDKISKLRNRIKPIEVGEPAAGGEWAQEDLQEEFKLRPPSAAKIAKEILALRNTGAEAHMCRGGDAGETIRMIFSLVSPPP